MMWCGAVLMAGVLTMGAVSAARATFIFNDGQRLTGTIVGLGNPRYNTRAATEFTVAVNNRREETIAAADVAVIDFVGGTITSRELQLLPEGQQALVMRNGNVRQGEFIALTASDTVRWANLRGGEVDIPIANVSRIYLDTNSALELFDTRGAVSTLSRRDQDLNLGLAEDELLVRANQRWTDTAINVRAGELYDFAARGRITWSNGDDGAAPADGNGVRVNVPSFPVPAMAVGGLVAKVGVNGEPFPIGSSQAAVRMPVNGRLYLGVNDDNFADNTGAFRVTVTRVR
jgi:hypothetical protein